jgi:hypothetical protein
MNITAITKILEDAISTRFVKNFGRKYQKTKISICKQGFPFLP